MHEILKQLVAFPSISGHGQASHDLLEYVSDFVQKRGMFVDWREWNGFESIIATTKPGTKRPKVMLAAHIDVVPGQPTLYNMRLADGKYYGRGVLDMKFAIAAYLQIIDDLRDNLADYDFSMMLTSDEELGGRDGVARLVDEGYIPEVCILPDGGDNWQVQTSSKGMWLFRIAADGRTAHGSRPWLGENALTKLLAVLQEITELFPKDPQPNTNTITLSQVTGGVAMNQVPDKATMLIDVRTTDSQEHARLYDAVTAICRKHGVDQEHISDAAPTHYDLKDPYIAPFVRLIEEIVGVKVRGHHALGASDVRYYVPYGVPCISVYPKGGDLHADGEWLDAQALDQFKEVVKRYLQQIALTQTAKQPANSTPVDVIS